MIDRRGVVLVVALCAAGACKKKSSPAGPGSGSAAAAGSGSGSGSAASTPAAVIDPLPDAVWAATIPPFRFDAPPSAVWADDKRLIAVVPGFGRIRIAAVDLATGAVTYGAPQEIDPPILALARLASGELVGFGSRHDTSGVYTVDPDKLIATARKSALDSTSARRIDTVTVAADGSVLVGASSEILWILAPDLSSVRTISTTDTWNGYASIDATHVIATKPGDTQWVIDTAAGTQTKLTAPVGTVVAAAGTAALASGRKGTQLFDTTTGQVRATIPTPAFHAAAFSADGATLLVYDGDTLTLHDPATGAERKRIAIGAGHDQSRQQARLIVASPHRAIVTVGAAVRVVDLEAGTVAALPPGPTSLPVLVAFVGADVITLGHPSYRYSATGVPAALAIPEPPPSSEDGVARAVRVTGGAVSPSGKFVVVMYDNAIAVLDPATGTSRMVPIEDPGATAVRDDGGIVVSWSHGIESIQIGELGADGKVDEPLVVTWDSAFDALTADGKSAIVSRDSAGLVVDVASHKPGELMQAPACEPYAVFALAPDGSRAAVPGNDDHSVAAYDARTAKLVAVATTTLVISTVFPLAGSGHVLMSVTGGVAVWDPDKATAKFTAIAGDVDAFAIDATGKRVALGFRSGRIAVYDLAKLEAGAPLPITAAEPPSGCDRIDPLAKPGDDEIGDGDGPD